MEFELKKSTEKKKKKVKKKKMRAHLLFFVVFLLSLTAATSKDVAEPKVPAVPAPFVSLVQRMIHRSLGDDLGCAPYKCKPTATSCCATTWGACMSGCRSDCLQNSAGLFCCTNIYPYGERCATDCPKC
jgi:hypothetical protein